MREIKFRAWISSSKEMITGGLQIGNFGDGEGSLAIDTCLQSGEALKGLVWQQYTGLKDKNNVEIYEGDICKYDDINGDNYKNNLIGKVKFDEGKFFVGDWGDISMASLNKRIEVIGNIYENKELLINKGE